MKFKFNIRIIALILALFCLLTCFVSCNRRVREHPEYESYIADSQRQTERETKHKKETEVEVETKPVMQGLTMQEIADIIKLSVIKVICYDADGVTETAQGSGFFIDNRGTFITNAHVIKDAHYLKIKNYLGVMYDVDTMFAYNDDNSDYAVCRASDYYRSQAVEFATEANVGDRVYALGYPKNVSQISVTVGKIMNTDAIHGTKHFYANNAEIDYGSSGGVLVDCMGRVLGITTGSMAEGAYLALKYQEFKFDADGEHNGGKEPYKFFYELEKCTFQHSSMAEYFDLSIDVVSDSDTSMSYDVTVKLKESFKDKKLLLTTKDQTKISVDVSTNYRYYDDIGNLVQNLTTTDTVYITVDSAEELVEGKTVTSNSILSDVEIVDYSSTMVNYICDFGEIQVGSMSAYTKIS